jgi:hypothetical protein
VLEQARARFAEGVAHTEAARWEDAVASFESALELHDAPAIRYNLAVALVELHRYQAADEQLSHVIGAEDVPENIAAQAPELRTRIEHEAGRLTVVAPERAEVTLDGEPLAPEHVGREIWVAEGTHTIAGRRGEATLAEQEVVVSAGQPAARVELAAPEAPGVPLHEDWRLWVGVGAGALTVLVTLIVVIAIASSGTEQAIPGNFSPAVLTWP